MSLVIVPTPIGNLGDITERAADALRSSDVIACEDTRRTLGLLNSLGIKRPLVTYHRHNEREMAQKLASRAAEGETVALVSDAGTPGISDPGHALIKAAIELGVAIDALPGPNALLPALLLSGLPARTFTFAGFIEGKPAERRRAFEELARAPHTVIIYSAPHDLARDLEFLREIFGTERRAAVVREISKLHQESLRGTLGELAELAREREIRGEPVIVIEGLVREERYGGGDNDKNGAWCEAASSMAAMGEPDREIARAIAERFGVAPNRVKRFLLKGEG